MAEINSSRPDFIVANHGSSPSFLLSPQTDAARTWIEKHIPREGFQPYWPTALIEPDNITDVIAAIRADGLVVES